jgi:hypothetical protein
VEKLIECLQAKLKLADDVIHLYAPRNVKMKLYKAWKELDEKLEEVPISTVPYPVRTGASFTGGVNELKKTMETFARVEKDRNRFGSLKKKHNG